MVLFHFKFMEASYAFKSLVLDVTPRVFEAKAVQFGATTILA